MNIQEKLNALSILANIWFKSKSAREAQELVIKSLKEELAPKDTLPLVLTEVFVDAPHVVTNYNTWPEVMNRIELVKEKENLYSIHVVRGGEIEYTWEAEKK